MTICQVCKYWGSDVRVKGCGCQIHTRCIPRSVVQPKGNGGGSSSPSCPCCNTPFTDLYLLPLSFEDLEESVRLRKIDALKKNKKRMRDDEDLDTEAQYLVFSQGRNTLSSTLSATDNARTGRWTDEEIAFVDHLVQAFDKGHLPLAKGVKLSSFLGDVLLCRASRLTKKMKNAKLSTRSYDTSTLNRCQSEMSGEDCQILSALQDRFIGSMNTKVAQLELKFNLVKQWRTYFSNLCIETGSINLDAEDWVASLEEMERRASTIEAQMRVVRRKRMGLGGTSNKKTDPPLKTVTSEPVIQLSNNLYQHASPKIVASSSDPHLMSNHQSLSDDLDHAFMSLYDSTASDFHNSFSVYSGGNPFLEAISRYMEKSGLPFQHADVWVPSMTSGEGDQVELLHAGHATRRDQGEVLLSTFSNFGEFSKSFSFRPNQGLPGRVYASGKPQWEFQLHEPSIFLRCQAADAFGLRTATGIPISTPCVGRMVVVFYSSTKLIEDAALAARCANELASYSPSPTWKLVIEIGNNQVDQSHLGGKKASPAMKAHQQRAEDSKPGAAQREDQMIAHDQREDQIVAQIVTLMGNEMSTNVSQAGESTSSSQELLPHIMAIRLLLLRNSENRSSEENDLVNILRGSFISYSQDRRKSGPELACLLAREYMCLKSIASSSSSAESRTYSSQHLMPNSLPPVVAFGGGMAGPPTRLPSIVSNSNSTHDLTTMRRTVSTAAIPSNTTASKNEKYLELSTEHPLTF